MFVIKATAGSYRVKYARSHWSGHYCWDDFNTATFFKTKDEAEAVLNSPTFTEPVDRGEGVIAHSESLYTLTSDEDPVLVTLEIVEVTLTVKSTQQITVINKYPKGIEYKY